MDAYKMGQADAESDFNNVGTDFARELADEALVAIDQGVSPKVAVMREMAAFRKNNAKDWYQESMNRAFSEDDWHGGSTEETRRYAQGYVTHYFQLIQEHLVGTLKEDLRRRKEEDEDRLSYRGRRVQQPVELRAAHNDREVHKAFRRDRGQAVQRFQLYQYEDVPGAEPYTSGRVIEFRGKLPSYEAMAERAHYPGFPWGGHGRAERRPVFSLSRIR